MIKGLGDRAVGWTWKLCNMIFESFVVPENCRYAAIVPLYKGKGERIECRNYRGISLLSFVGKIYAGTLKDRARRVTGLIDDEQLAFREGRSL